MDAGGPAARIQAIREITECIYRPETGIGDQCATGGGAASDGYSRAEIIRG